MHKTLSTMMTERAFFYIHKLEVVKKLSLFRFAAFLHTAESHL